MIDVIRLRWNGQAARRVVLLAVGDERRRDRGDPAVLDPDVDRGVGGPGARVLRMIRSMKFESFYLVKSFYLGASIGSVR